MLYRQNPTVRPTFHVRFSYADSNKSIHLFMSKKRAKTARVSAYIESGANGGLTGEVFFVMDGRYTYK